MSRAEGDDLVGLAEGVVNAIARLYARLGSGVGDHFSPTELRVLDLVFSCALAIAERRALQFGREG